jgi:hypothetical protein
MTNLRGLIQIADDFIPIKSPPPQMRRDRVVLNGGKTSIAYRAMFENWQMDVNVIFNANGISRDQIRTQLATKGRIPRHTGTGDLRTEKVMRMVVRVFRWERVGDRST